MDPDSLPRKKISRFAAWIVGFAVAAASAFLVSYLSGYLSNSSVPNSDGANELRVLAYTSFTSSWGPGPEIAKRFEAKRPGAHVILLQAEDAGLLLAKMRAFPADVVLGFDQLGKRLAEKKEHWKPHLIKGARFSDDRFLAFDWAPLGFIYREGEIKPPVDFNDLLDSRFEGTIALQDPRSSSPGFQFLNWLVLEMGEDQAFAYLRKLKPNVHSMSGSWSQAYGLFTRGLSKITFGYATSILYHQISEHDDRYRFVTFPVKHPIQIEYAAISAKCVHCELARSFLEFLREPEIQSVIMNRNWMLPVIDSAATGTPFADLLKEVSSGTGLKVRDPSTKDDLKDPAATLERWRREGL